MLIILIMDYILIDVMEDLVLMVDFLYGILNFMNIIWDFLDLKDFLSLLYKILGLVDFIIYFGFIDFFW